MSLRDISDMKHDMTERAGGAALMRHLSGLTSGAAPIVLGLLLLAAIFQGLNANFLTPGNLVNLMIQGAVYMLLAMGMVFVLLIGEVDLSIGFIGGVAGVVMATLAYGDGSWPWYVAVGAGLLAGTAIGTLHGAIITAIGLPSFVVTLAGLLAWNGVMLMILGNGGVVPIQEPHIIALASGLVSPTVGWIVAALGVAVYGVRTVRRDARRRRAGHVAPPPSATALRIALIALAVGLLMALFTVDRGAFRPVVGVPIIVIIVAFFLTLWSIVLSETAFGAHVYAVGGNAEAARRAGIRVDALRIAVFALSGFMGAVAGIIYASRLRSVSTNLDGGTLVLYAIAAAVIGGCSLFGGRGRASNAILGGLVIATIDNGMGLLGLSAAARYVVTGLVLVLAVSIDALARRRRAASGQSR